MEYEKEDVIGNVKRICRSSGSWFYFLHKSLSYAHTMAINVRRRESIEGPPDGTGTRLEG